MFTRVRCSRRVFAYHVYLSSPTPSQPPSGTTRAHARVLCMLFGLNENGARALSGGNEIKGTSDETLIVKGCVCVCVCVYVVPKDNPCAGT